MARKFSTGLRNALLGSKPSVTATTISFDSGSKTIADSGNGLAVFQPGDSVIVTGAGQGANNKTVTIVSVANTGASMVVAESLSDEAAGSTVTLALANSRAWKDIFRNCVIECYSGAQPSDADQAETGTRLLRITASGGSFSPGAATNGLNWENPSGGTISKASGETWVGTGLADGTLGWFRCYANRYQTGSSATAVRFDGSIGITGGQLNLATTAIRTGQNVTIDGFQVTMSA